MAKTIPKMILDLASERSDKVALRRKKEGTYRDITWKDLESQVRLFGRAMMRVGIEKGDRVAIMSPNAPEWVYCDLGAMAAGGLSVPVYHTEGLDTILHILKDSGSRLLFIHSALIAKDILARRDELPQLKKIVLLYDDEATMGVQTLADFLTGGDEVPFEELERRLVQTGAEEIATIVYTSGTTGAPKGVCLTHRNILSNLEACADTFPIGPGDECLSFLPLSHVFERVDGYYFMLRNGVVISYAESIDTVTVNLQEVRPTVMISVPRLYEKMYARVMERVLSGPYLRKQIFFAALRAGRAHVRIENEGREPSAPLRAVVKLARKAVFSKLTERLGGRMRFFISGGAPLAGDIDLFFRAAGIPVYEGYGLTETAGGIAVNSPEASRAGTVGRIFPNTEARIAEDGEILLRGDGVFETYWERPDDTRNAFTDGWFMTGDTGKLDKDGFLSITDRKKDIIVTAGGKNIAPQPIENRFKSDKFIANTVVFGDKRPFLVALIVPNLENVEKFARSKRLDFLNHCDLVNLPQVLRLIRERVDHLQKDLPSFQRIKRFTLLSQDLASSQVTPTLKVKRKVVEGDFREVLEAMYHHQDHGIHDAAFCIVDSGTEEENKT